MFCSIKYNADVWHSGRFQDVWADENIKDSLTRCFAVYDRTGMISALRETFRLFTQLSESVAEFKGYVYPETAADYAEFTIREWFRIVD